MADCCPELPVFYVRDPNTGNLVPLPTIDGAITIPGLAGETEWTGIEGDGIAVVAGGENGHAPTFSLRVSPDTSIPITFDDEGRIKVGPFNETKWTTPNTVATNGIKVTAGGTNGHRPAFELVLDSDFFNIDENGALTFIGDTGSGFTCASLSACSIGSLGDVDTAGVQVGDVLVYTVDGWRPGQALVACGHVLDSGETATAVGTRLYACDVIDLAGSDPETVASAANYPERWVQSFTNGVSGSEEFIVLADAGTGAMQWHQLDG